MNKQFARSLSLEIDMTAKHFVTLLFAVVLLASVSLNAQGQVISTEYGPPSAANEWQKFSIPLTAESNAFPIVSPIA